MLYNIFTEFLEDINANVLPNDLTGCLRLTGRKATLEGMTVELKPETEQLLREEIENGHLTTVDELIVFAVQALREKDKSAHQSAPRPRRKLYDLLTQPPFAGCELNLERVKEYPRPVDL